MLQLYIPKERELIATVSEHERNADFAISDGFCQPTPGQNEKTHLVGGFLLVEAFNRCYL